MDEIQALEAKRDRLSGEIVRLKEKYGHDEMIDLLEGLLRKVNSEIALITAPAAHPARHCLKIELAVY